LRIEETSCRYGDDDNVDDDDDDDDGDAGDEFM